MLGNTEDKREEGNRGWMDRQYNWLNEHELEKTPGYSEGWGSWVGAVHEVVKSWT